MSREELQLILKWAKEGFEEIKDTPSAARTSFTMIIQQINEFLEE